MTLRDDLRAGGHLVIPNWLLERTDLTTTDKFIIAVFIDFLFDNQEAWPSCETVGLRLNTAPDSIRRALKRICRIGIMQRLPGKSKDGTNRYTVHLVRRTESTVETGQLVQSDRTESTVATVPLVLQTKVLTQGIRKGRGKEEEGLTAPAAPQLPFLAVPTIPTAEHVNPEGAGNGTTQTIPTIPTANPIPPEGVTVVNPSLTVPTTSPAEPKTGEALTSRNNKSRQGKTTKMTDAESILVRSTALNMFNYLLFGIDYFRVADNRNLPPVDTNWRVHGGSLTDPKCDLWTTRQFMGFYWKYVTAYQEAHNIPIALPDWGRLGTTIKAVRETLTPFELYDLIRNTIDHFGLIKYLIGGAIGNTLTPTESTLTHQLVRQAMTTFDQLDRYGRLDQAYQCMKAGKPLPQNLFQ